MFTSYPSGRAFASSFQLVRRAFLQADGLPFGDVLSEEENLATWRAHTLVGNAKNNSIRSIAERPQNERGPA
jgi:hypothetical protein